MHRKQPSVRHCEDDVGMFLQGSQGFQSTRVPSMLHLEGHAGTDTL